MTKSNIRWLDYETVWRWHGYAGIICLPIILLLSVTGCIYLFKPQIEGWLDAPYDKLSTSNERAVIADQVRSALAAHPGSRVVAYELPRDQHSSARVLLKKDGHTARIFVDPSNSRVLGERSDSDGFIRSVRQLHGQLMLGDRGSNVVEIVASWTVILIITGLYLWWPINAKGFGGILYPRWRKQNPAFVRELHSVVGFWVSSLALFLIFTGLPWAKFWGSYFRYTKSIVGIEAQNQDWTLGGKSIAKGSGEHQRGDHQRSESSRKGSLDNAADEQKIDYEKFDDVYRQIQSMRLDYPALIVPPTAKSAVWTAKSDSQNRTLRKTIEFDPTTMAIRSTSSFDDKHWLDRLVAVGISAHEGQLFGVANQILGLAATGGLILLSTSGSWLWWKNRRRRALRHLHDSPPRRLPKTFPFIVLAIAILLPLFGATLLVVLLVDQVVSGFKATGHQRDENPLGTLNES